MEASLQGAPLLALIGIGAVFVVLTALLGAVLATARLLNGRARGAARAPAATLGPVDSSLRAKIEQDLEAVALAAYALHLAGRVSIPDPEPPSQWVVAGRMRQAAPFWR
jgi:hypothetical protein